MVLPYSINLLRPPLVALGVSLLCAQISLGCSSAPARPIITAPLRTCVVLSVGEFYGIAHAGALRQLQRQLQNHGQRIDCVVGNSMGAVVGALYASEPQQDPVERMRALLVAYGAQSEREFAQDQLKYLAAEAIKKLTEGTIDIGAFRRLAHGRFVRVMDTFVAGRLIEQLSLPFATFHQRRDGGGLVLVTVRTGNVAHAVGASAANPLIFDDVDIKTAAQIDPGADRLSAVPVSDACRLFPDARLIAINVTGEPLAVAAETRCPVEHIVVPRRPSIDRADAAKGGPEFDRLIGDGEAAVLSWRAPK